MLKRPRRNRKSASIREMVEENQLSVSDLIFPLFLLEGPKDRVEVASMPGIFRLGLDKLLKEIEECLELGIKVFDVFPVVPEKYKDKIATYSWNEDNFYLQALSKIKASFPEAAIMTDVAMDPYSIDGHDGYVESGRIINDQSLEFLGKMALAQAQAGADIVGPSDMMDGRVAHIRKELDRSGFSETSIMSYTAKYASAFYGPFRDALDSAPKSGDKKTYQMNPANAKEAELEAALDIEEGADILMVKPGTAYLDIVYRLSNKFDIPVTAYHVSGEYSMIKAADQKGWISGHDVALESLLAFKRAGASAILTYFSKEVAGILKERK